MACISFIGYIDEQQKLLVMNNEEYQNLQKTLKQVSLMTWMNVYRTCIKHMHTYT
jgi:hypothetical protein